MDSATHAEAVRHALSEVATEDRASSSRSSGSSWHFNADELDGLDGMDADEGTCASLKILIYRKMQIRDYFSLVACN